MHVYEQQCPGEAARDHRVRSGPDALQTSGVHSGIHSMAMRMRFCNTGSVCMETIVLMFCEPIRSDSRAAADCDIAAALMVSSVLLLPCRS